MALRLPGLRRARRSRSSRSTRTPTASTSTPRSSSSSTRRGFGSTRSRSRPTTATRSATSTAWGTPRTSRRTCSATGRTSWASARARRPSPTSAYDVKEGADSSHGRIQGWMSMLPPSRILDLGCSDGELGARLMEMGHEVVGVDFEEHKGVREKLTDFFQADLEDGIPEGVGGDYDIVLCADVLEHVRAPEKVLDGARAVLRPGGSVITSIPNFGHWYPRGRVADRPLRLRRPGHPRPRPPALLHEAELRPPRRVERVGDPAPGVDRAAAGGRRPRRLLHRRERLPRRGAASRPSPGGAAAAALRLPVHLRAGSRHLSAQDDASRRSSSQIATLRSGSASKRPV